MPFVIQSFTNDQKLGNIFTHERKFRISKINLEFKKMFSKQENILTTEQFNYRYKRKNASNRIQIKTF